MVAHRALPCKHLAFVWSLVPQGFDPSVSFGWQRLKGDVLLLQASIQNKWPSVECVYACNHRGVTAPGADGVSCTEQFPLTTLVTWECTIRHAVPWPAVDSWSALRSPRSLFMAAAMEKSVAHERARSPQPAGWIACDPLAVALAAEHGLEERNILTGSTLVHCSVELAGGLARGQSVFGSKGMGDNVAPRVRLVTSVDVKGFEKLLYDSMR